MARTALIKSTNASIQDCSMYSTVSGISITASTPDGTSMKFVVRKEMAPHSSILAGIIPRSEEPGLYVVHEVTKSWTQPEVIEHT